MSYVAGELNQLRIALGEISILVTLTKGAYDNAEWDDPDPDIVDGIASLLGLISKSATEATAAFHVLHAAVVDAQRSMSAEDAAIIRRIRTLCPDRRFDGGTDEELIQLFKRNKQVLNRSDEDVIAAMTHEK